MAESNPTPPAPNPAPSPAAGGTPGTGSHTCAHCGKGGATSKCSRCKVVRFCSRSCQVAAWPAHKKVCGIVCTRCSAASPADPASKIMPTCSRCKATPYCSTACQQAHWAEHKATCRTPFQRGEALLKLKKAAEAVPDYKVALVLAKQSGDLEELANAHNGMGRALEMLEDFTAALEEYRQGELTAEKTGDGVLIAVSLRNTAYCYSAMGDIDASAAMWHRVIDLCASLGNHSSVAAAHYRLGNMYHEAGREELAVHHIKTSLVMAEKLGYVHTVGSAFITLGNAYLKLVVRMEEALAAFQRGRDIGDQMGDRVSRGR